MNKKLLPLKSMKEYMMVFNETSAPPSKPNLDRSPSNFRRSMSNSPNSNQQNNNNNNTNSPNNNNNSNTSKNNSNSGQNGGKSSTNTNAATTSSSLQPNNNSNALKPVNLEQLVSYKTRLKEEPSLQRNSTSILFKKSGNGEIVTKSTNDLSKTSDFAKLRYNALKTRNATNITSLALKPATVEGTS